jgi:hypothetical protein
MHELGHVLGYDHDDAGVMDETLPPGTRRLWDAELAEPDTGLRLPLRPRRATVPSLVGRCDHGEDNGQRRKLTWSPDEGVATLDELLTHDVVLADPFQDEGGDLDASLGDLTLLFRSEHPAGKSRSATDNDLAPEAVDRVFAAQRNRVNSPRHVMPEPHFCSGR